VSSSLIGSGPAARLAIAARPGSADTPPFDAAYQQRSPRRRLLPLAILAVATAGLTLGCPSVQQRVVASSTVTYLPVEGDEPEGPPAEAPPRWTPEDEAEARGLLAEGRARATEGDEVGARVAYRAVAGAHPESPEGVEARVTLAADALERGDFEVAAALTPELEAVPEEAGLAYRAAMLRAYALAGLRAFEAAAGSFAAALERAREEGERREAAEGLARTAYYAGDPGRAQLVVAAHLASADAHEDQVRLVTAELALGNVSDDALEGLYRSLPRGSVHLGYVAVEVAERACRTTRPERCAEAAQLALALVPELAWRERAQQLLELTEAWRRVRPRTIGVLLPETGRFANIGQAARVAIEQALEEHPDLRVVWRDTAGDADRARELAQALILDEHVAAILGPVGQRESAAAAEVSARFGVPHVPLSSGEETAAAGPSVIRLRLSAQEQGRAVARWAATVLNVRRVGILFPESEHGQTLMGAFWDEIVRLGGEVWAVESYEAADKDFHDVIKRLIGAARPGEGDTRFDALFVPDSATNVRRLLPFLKYWGLPVRTSPGATGVQLLGGAGWNHRTVIDLGDNLSDNAVFADAFFHDPDDPLVDRFAKRFFMSQREPPRPFHAEVYDAANVLARAISPVRREDHTARLEILGRLTHTRNHAGVTGLISVLADGTLVRTPRLLTVDLDDIRLRLSEEEERILRRERFGPRGERR